MKTPLLDILSSRFPDSSNNFLKSLLKHNRVLVKGNLTTRNIFIDDENDVSVLPKRRLVQGVQVLYEDTDLVIVDKPQGLLSVATRFEEKNTLHALLKKAYPSVWPVQRLDRETSGVMVFGLSYQGKEGLKKQFMEHSIYREYQALVDGEFKGKGTWKSKLYEDASYVMKISEDSGELAITHYESLESFKKHSRLKFVLETGKKNQIRVQAAHAGHPIVGDKKYGSSHFFLRRLALHAHKLEFTHPISGKKLSFTSPVPF